MERLHSEEFYVLYFLPHIIRVVKSGRMRWSGHVARMRERRGAYRILVGRSEGKRPFGRSARKLEGNIKADLQEMRWGGMGSIYLAQCRDRWRVLVNAVLNLRVPLKFGEFFDYFTPC